MRKRSLALLSLLALLLALSGAGAAATGGNFILGKANNADATTTLAAPVGGGTALQLSNTNTAAGSTALSLNVVSGHPPLTVNSGAGKAANLNVDMLDGKEANRFWQLGGNTVNTIFTLGTANNHPLWFVVNGQKALRIAPNATSPIIVGGFSGNSVDPAAFGATISGGGSSGNVNTITTNAGFATIAGGQTNTASGLYSAVGGGQTNTASGLYSAEGGGLTNTASGVYSAVGGGNTNTASGPDSAVGGGTLNTASGDWSTVAGGDVNTASGDHSAVAGGDGNTAGGHRSAVGGGVFNTAGGDASTVAGGNANTASGNLSTVAGGRLNTASGNFSFAAGRRGKATDNGSFVWADSQDFDISSNGTNTFTARTTGGARFISAIDGTTGAPTAGVTLATGGGSWGSLSDRAAKRGFTPVDRRTLLQRLDRVPISRWGYKAQAPSIRHLGPTAQDFFAAFGLGEDNRHIDTIDSEGVALAAIQGLYRQNQALERRNEKLTSRLANQNARLTKLERKVAKLAR